MHKACAIYTALEEVSAYTQIKILCRKLYQGGSHLLSTGPTAVRAFVSAVIKWLSSITMWVRGSMRGENYVILCTIKYELYGICTPQTIMVSDTTIEQ